MILTLWVLNPDRKVEGWGGVFLEVFRIERQICHYILLLSEEGMRKKDECNSEIKTY